MKNTTGQKKDYSFGYLNVTQFLGAFNDNFYKIIIILAIVALSGSTENTGRVTALAGAVFVVPFLLFSAFAGKLADRFSKRSITVTVKIAELVIMILGCAAIFMNSPMAMYAVLFLMAVQSAFFGPSKYGIIPELVNKERLSGANGSLEAMTYIAIILGATVGPALAYLTANNFKLIILLCPVVALAGIFTSLKIKSTPAGDADIRPSLLFVIDIWRSLRSISRKKELILCVFASAYFLLIGGFLFVNLLPYGMEHLKLSTNGSGLLFVLAAVGIAVGSYVSGKLSGRNVEFGVVPVGATGLAVFSIALGLISPNLYAASVLIFLAGISAGLFIVPIYAYIQLKSPKQRRGRILAASNFLGWVGVLAASGLVYLFNILRLTAAQGFIILGLITLLMAVIAVKLLPDFLVRFICLVLTKSIYRIKVNGIDNLPSEGPALIVCNHVSYVDPLLLNAVQQRRIRFLMDREFYDIKLLNPIARLMKAIPILATDPPKKIIESLKQARQALDSGSIVCIFAEGALTRNGMLLSFKSGFEKIVKGRDYPIIPAYIGGAWGSIFSYYYGKPLSTVPKKFPYPVSIHFGSQMPSNSSANQIRTKVSELSCDYFESLKPRRRSIADHFIEAARKNRRRHCMSDTTGKKYNYGQALTASIALAKQLRQLNDGSNMIGILLPPSNPAALTNIAAGLLGKVAVNLNYVVSHEQRASALERCGIKTVITSRAFVEKTGIEPLNGMVFIEDVVKQVSTKDKITAYIKAQFMPRMFLTNSAAFHADDLLTVIFSSGSSGRPKGVMLSHHNVLSNIEALRAVFQLKSSDNLCAILPFFHSFGFTCSLWLPLISGVSSVYISNPLDAAVIGDAAKQNRSTILFAAPTFLLNYLRRIPAEDFASMRAVVVGAEKLKPQIADAFEEKFKIRPLEGYGSTELSPVISLNLSDVDAGGMCHKGSKPGSVGHPIPGVAVKAVDPDTMEPLPIGRPGLLLVRGPNLMLGYLSDPEKTAQVITDGWYNTGDIVTIDEDGFITITDRLSRFSKIGGEMVPHLGIEDYFHSKLNTSEQVVAVTSIPDSKKGEELVVVYLEGVADPAVLHQIASESSLPNLWKPKPDNYIPVTQMPVLGSGKLDIMKLKKIALNAKNIARA